MEDNINLLPEKMQKKPRQDAKAQSPAPVLVGPKKEKKGIAERLKGLFGLK